MLTFMALLQVDVAGLRVLAARCQSLAGEMSADGTATLPAPPTGQATASAVAAVHASVAVAGAAMTTRLSTTSTRLITAASTFSDQEARSAESIAALAPVTAG